MQPHSPWDKHQGGNQPHCSHSHPQFYGSAAPYEQFSYRGHPTTAETGNLGLPEEYQCRRERHTDNPGYGQWDVSQQQWYRHGGYDHEERSWRGASSSHGRGFQTGTGVGDRGETYRDMPSECRTAVGGSCEEAYTVVQRPGEMPVWEDVSGRKDPATFSFSAASHFGWSPDVVSSVDLIREELGSQSDVDRTREDILHQSRLYPCDVDRGEKTSDGLMESRWGDSPLHSQRSMEEEHGARTTPAIAREEYASSFAATVQKFVVKHAEVFDALVMERTEPSNTPPHNLKTGDSFKFAEPDALEYHMGVNSIVRKGRFFQLVAMGDVVRGHVTAKKHGGLSLRVTLLIHSHKAREISDLEIKGLVSFEKMAGSYDKRADFMSETQLDDVIQAVVVGVDPTEETVTLSLREDHLSTTSEGVKLGYMEDKRPLSPRSGFPEREDFLQQLEEDPGFINPLCTGNLKATLGISSHTRPSLLREIQLGEYPESDYCDSLRKTQRGKWSMETVAVGVRYFKAGEHSTAMKYFHHALEIDPENVEGLVARGALYANSEKYREAITDFETALTIRRTHKNARRYLVETQVTYGRELERRGNLERAMRCYREALADDPEQEVARTRLGVLTIALEKQAAERRERERKEEEEKLTLKKLHKIIEKEKKKKSKKTKQKKRKKTSKPLKKQKKKTTKREHLSSSEEEESTVTASSDSEFEGERERSHSSSPEPERDSARQKGRRKRTSKSERIPPRGTFLSDSDQSDGGRGRERRRRQSKSSDSASVSEHSPTPERRKKRTKSGRRHDRSSSRSRSRERRPSASSAKKHKRIS